MGDRLQLVIRTPHEVALDELVLAARIPSRTGHVGLRPREEPFLIVVDPGLIVLRVEEGARFVATAGGLLDLQRGHATLFTPFAVVGREDRDVLSALDRALEAPDGELSARRHLRELEQRIVRELRDRTPAPAGISGA